MEELPAPSHWTCIDFISDLHLQESEPATYAAWRSYLQQTTANAVFILGDLFEVWVGDDMLSLASGFERQCAQALHAAAQRMDIHILCGNRDFLMGSALMQACGCTLLPDPTVLEFAGQRWLLSHGDALCLDDVEYLQFRSMVRSAQWQNEFLQRPLEERLSIGRSIRAQSKANQRGKTVYADVDHSAATALLHSVHAAHMIHGHTHRPARHALSAGMERLVLSDWDVGAQPARAEVLRLRQTGEGSNPSCTVERIPPSMA